MTPGTKLGPYEILSSLGAGGMGEVYRARDTRLDRIVAIKILPDRFSDRSELRERFEREARTIASLNHPHICTLYDIGHQDGTDYLVMECLEGDTLTEKLAKGPLPLDQVLRCAIENSDALDKAHRKGVTHRDLKPGNIMLTNSGAKLLDFGLAKLRKEASPAAHLSQLPTADQPITAQGMIVGTLQYMAPEQLEGKEADARTDLFAFGTVVYEMVTGKKAFQGNSQASLIGAILHSDPQAMASLRPITPPALDRVVKTCLAKDPEDRWQAAADVAKELKWIAEGGSHTGVVEAAIPRTNLRRRWWFAGAAAMLLAVLAVVGLWMMSHLHQPPDEMSVLRVSINPPQGGLLSFGSNLGGLAISPDGKTVAFVASGTLWVRPLDGMDARMLPGTEGAFYPFWSPDSKSLAFFSDKLRRIDLAGGPPVTICDVDYGRGGAWTEDGQIIFAGIFTSGLLRVPATGGSPAPLTTLDASRGEQTHWWPQVLPGGRLLFLIRSDKPENSGVFAISLAKPNEKVRVLTTDIGALYGPGNNGRNYLLWQREGTLVAQEFDSRSLRLAGELRTISNRVATDEFSGALMASASNNGLLLYGSGNTMSQLSWFDRSGKRLGAVGEPGQYQTFRLSPDGRIVAFDRGRLSGSDLWLLDTQRGVASRFTARPGRRDNYWPVWSPDGRTIIFTSDETNHRNAAGGTLYRKAAGGTGDGERLIDSNLLQFPTDWSRDGRYLFYSEITSVTANTTGSTHIWVLPVTPDGKPTGIPRLYLRSQFDEINGRFSPQPNPRWVVYESDESGREEIYVDAFPEPRSKIRISTDGGWDPEWSPDGRELFYVSLDLKLMGVSLKTVGDVIGASAPRELFAPPIFFNGFSAYVVAPDGRFLIRTVPEGQASQPLTLLSNWPALLKQAPAAQ